MDKKNENNEEQKSLNQSKSAFINKVKHTPIYRLFSQKQMKRYMVVACSAVVIGLLFGFTTLKVLNHVGQPKDVGAITTSKPDEHHNSSNEDVITDSIARVNAFVIQGGVFSNEQNLKQWESQFIDKGYNVVKWKRDDLYYLFIGLGQTESELSKLKEELIKKDLDVYIKVWETDSYELNLNEAELEWINTFMSLLEQSIDNINDDSLFEQDWKSLVEQDKPNLETVNTLKEDAMSILNKGDLQHEKGKRIVLLKLWHSLEQFAQSHKS